MTSSAKFWPALPCIMCAQLASVSALAQNEHADHAAGDNLGVFARWRVFRPQNIGGYFTTPRFSVANYHCRGEQPSM
jgi:hypothetical protein